MILKIELKLFRFSTKYLEEKHLNKLEAYDIKAILSTLEFLIQYNWESVIFNKVKKYHIVPIKRVKEHAPYISNYHKKCEEQETGNDSKKLISFAYKDKGRLLGFRDKEIFFITYVDKDHNYTESNT